MGESKLSSIRVNQIGYMTGIPVRISVLSDGKLTVKNSDGNTVLEKDNIELKYDPSSGDNVSFVDLGVLPEGEYTVCSGDDRRKIKVLKDA